jgi:hypothetical protein
LIPVSVLQKRLVSSDEESPIAPKKTATELRRGAELEDDFIGLFCIQHIVLFSSAE